MKNSITKLALLFFGTGSLFAQEKEMSTSISVNMNSGSSSSEGVSKNFGLNPNIGANFFWGKLGAGLDVGTFNSSPDFDFAGYANENFGGTKRVQIPTDREISSSTYFLVGPQYMIRKGKMNIVLATKAGITMNKMAEFQVVDELSTKTLASYKAPDDFAKNAFTIKPSLSIGYDLSKSFSLTANAQFIKQTGQDEFTTSYRNLSNVQTVDLKGNPLRQPEITKNIGSAPVINSTTRGASEFMSFGIGLTYVIRASGKHFKDATISMSAAPVENSTTTTNTTATVAQVAKADWAYKAQKAAATSGSGKVDFEYVPQKSATNTNSSDIEYSYKPQEAIANTNSSDIEYSYKPQKAVAQQNSGSGTQTVGWDLRPNKKVIMNPGNGNSGTPNQDSQLAIATKGKHFKDATLSMAIKKDDISNSGKVDYEYVPQKSAAVSNSESVNANANVPPKPLQAAGILGIKTKAIKKVGDVPLGKMKSKTSELQIQLNAIEKTSENLIYESQNIEHINPLSEVNANVPQQREALEKNDTFTKKQKAVVDFEYVPQKSATASSSGKVDFEYKPQKSVANTNSKDIEYSYKPQKADGSVVNPNSENSSQTNAIQSEYIKLKLSDDKSKSSEASGNLNAIGRGIKPDGSNDSSPVPVKPSIKNDGKWVIVGGASASAYAATGMAVQPNNNQPQVIERGTKPHGSNDSSPVPVKPSIKKGWDGTVKGSGIVTDIETPAGITEGQPIKGIIVKGGKNPGGTTNKQKPSNKNVLKTKHDTAKNSVSNIR
jgi:hypothetical protein